nr:E3 ubiquitin-protein ligase ZNRF3-like [Camelus dromedarius]
MPAAPTPRPPAQDHEAALGRAPRGPGPPPPRRRPRPRGRRLPPPPAAAAARAACWRPRGRRCAGQGDGVRGGGAVRIEPERRLHHLHHGLTGRFSRAGATLSAEGEIVQDGKVGTQTREDGMMILQTQQRWGDDSTNQGTPETASRPPAAKGGLGQTLRRTP